MSERAVLLDVFALIVRPAIGKRVHHPPKGIRRYRRLAHNADNPAHAITPDSSQVTAIPIPLCRTGRSFLERRLRRETKHSTALLGGKCEGFGKEIQAALRQRGLNSKRPQRCLQHGSSSSEGPD